MKVIIQMYDCGCTVQNWPTRAGRQDMLHVPIIREVLLVGTRKRALSVVAPTLWNIIPLEIESLAPILIFF